MSTLKVDSITPTGSSGIQWNSNYTGGVLASLNMPAGAILSVTPIRYSTRTSLGAATSRVVFTGNITKQSSTSILVCEYTIYMGRFYDGNSGTGIVLDGTTWGLSGGYGYDGLWSSAEQTTLDMGHTVFTGVSAGSHTIGWGWRYANGNNSFPCYYINPNNNEDARNQQFVSTILVYEVEA